MHNFMNLFEFLDKDCLIFSSLIKHYKFSGCEREVYMISTSVSVLARRVMNAIILFFIGDREDRGGYILS